MSRSPATATPTPTQTPTVTDTPSSSPTPTRDYDVQPQPIVDGEIDALDLIQSVSAIKDGTEAGLLLFDFSVHWKIDTDN